MDHTPQRTASQPASATNTPKNKRLRTLVQPNSRTAPRAGCSSIDAFEADASAEGVAESQLLRAAANSDAMLVLPATLVVEGFLQRSRRIVANYCCWWFCGVEYVIKD